MSLLVHLLLICSVAALVICTTRIAIFGNGVTIESGTIWRKMVRKMWVLRYHRCVIDNSVLLALVAPRGHSPRTLITLTMCAVCALEASVKNYPLTRRRCPRNVIFLRHLDPWRWRRCVLCKRLEPITQSHGVISRKKGVVETKDLVHKYALWWRRVAYQEMTNWWINRSAHDIAWCWRNW